MFTHLLAFFVSFIHFGVLFVCVFQSNFYIDDTCEQPQPSPCELCDGDQDASYECRKCKNKFCSRCRRVHDKFCHSTQVTPIATTTVRSTHKIVTFEGKVQNQAKVIQSALKQLEEDAKEVSRQRQGIEDDLNIRYAKGLRLLAEAHQECLRSLRDAAETVERRLQAEIEAAKEAHARLSKLSCKPWDASNQSGMQGAEMGLLSDADLQRSMPGQETAVSFPTKVASYPHRPLMTASRASLALWRSGNGTWMKLQMQHWLLMNLLSPGSLFMMATV